MRDHRDTVENTDVGEFVGMRVPEGWGTSKHFPRVIRIGAFVFHRCVHRGHCTSVI